MFYVVYGSLRIQFEGRDDVVLNAGDFCIVPKNTMHNPVADAECGIALIETVTTLHTGDTPSPLAKSIDAQLAG